MIEKTERQYTEISTRLIKRYERETEKNWKDAPIAFCRWVFDLSKDWENSTWRLRKSALIYFMRNFGPAEAVEYLANVQRTPKPKKKKAIKRTSQKKARKISIVDLQLLMDTLQRQTKGRYDPFIARWMLAGLLVGVRPCEWFGARIEGDALLLKNAKFGPNRSCGEFRTIHFSKDKLDNLATVYEFVAELTAMNLTEQEFTNLYQQCRRRLWLINRKLWPGRKEKICLYTARHQFSANAKSTMGLIAVAALMGHRSTDTATRNYLKRQYGDNKMIFVEPDEKNMQLVDDKFKGFKPAYNGKNIK